MREKSFPRFSFSTLVGVESVRLTNPPGGSAEICGKWRDRLKEFSGPRGAGRLIEDFLNWRGEDSEILRFTTRYGPLHDVATPSGEFRFPPDAWRTAQSHFRQLWKRACEYPFWEIREDLTSLGYRVGKIVCCVGTLYYYLYLDLTTIDPKHLKICKRSDCPNPYFVADHLNSRYCSPPCGAWAQRRSKRKWWREHRSGTNAVQEEKMSRAIDTGEEQLERSE